MEKFYDCFLFDEVQDLGGHDFDLIQSIAPTKIDCIFVGDFYQHTYDTSNDGNINSGLYKVIKKYIKIWNDNGINVDLKSLSNSYRCSQTTCDFVRNNLKIPIYSFRSNTTRIIDVNNQSDADALFSDSKIVKLFFSEAYKYKCYAENWGKSKGLDCFQDVCIVLNKTTLKEYNNNTLHKLSPSTLNKLYVACTRAKGDIYFIPHTFFDNYKL